MSILGGLVLGRRETMPCFQSLGTRRCVIHTLKIATRTGVSLFTLALSVSYVTPSAPGDFLDGNLLIAVLTSFSSTGFG